MSKRRFTVAIQPDDYGPDDASSRIWKHHLLARGHDVREVDVYRADILEQLRGCHGFMWRHGHYSYMRQIASRLLPVIERGLGLVVYPDQHTCWHYDDKVAQSYIFEAASIPSPKTWVWYKHDAAKEWARIAEYPVVLKLRSGAGASNVLLIRSYREAEGWIGMLFGRGVNSMTDARVELFPLGRRRIRSAAKLLLRGVPPLPPSPPECAWELHKNYALFQEFLSNNEFDTRVTVIGNRAFGFRRFNRANDFRASGSGRIDHDPEVIAPEFVRLAFDVARKLKMQSCAIDGLWRGDEAVVGEISYTYLSRAVYDCPGHWDAEMTWHEGHMWPEEAQIRDFIAKLETTGERRVSDA